MKRIALAALASLALLAVVAATFDVPDPFAIHFATDGQADGFAKRAALYPLTVGLPAIVAGLLLAITRTDTRPPSGTRWMLGLPVGIIWGVGGVIVVTLAAQDGLRDAADATIATAWIPAVLGLSIVVTVLASRLAVLDDPTTTDAAAPARNARTELPAGATAVWVGTTPVGRAPMVLAAAVGAMGIGLGAVVSWWIAPVLGALALLLVASSRFTVTIGPAGILVSGRLFGWPRLEVPLDTITGADTSEIRPLEYGGWGVRTQPGLATTAVITRSGPGLTLARTDGSRVVVSLDDPDRAAGVVGTLLDRRGPGAASHSPTGRI